MESGELSLDDLIRRLGEDVYYIKCPRPGFSNRTTLKNIVGLDVCFGDCNLPCPRFDRRITYATPEQKIDIILLARLVQKTQSWEKQQERLRKHAKSRNGFYKRFRSKP